MQKSTLDDKELNRLQLTTLHYYLHEVNPANGLVRDKTDKTAPASIAAVGLALASLPVESYAAYCSTYQWRKIYGREILHCVRLKESWV